MRFGQNQSRFIANNTTSLSHDANIKMFVVSDHIRVCSLKSSGVFASAVQVCENSLVFVIKHLILLLLCFFHRLEQCNLSFRLTETPTLDSLQNLRVLILINKRHNDNILTISSVGGGTLLVSIWPQLLCQGPNEEKSFGHKLTNPF